MKTGIRIAVLGVASVLVAGIYFFVRQHEFPRSPNPQRTSVRVGYQAIASNIPFFVAVEQGFFRNHGIDVEAVRFETADAAIDGLIRGDIITDFSVPFMVFLTREAQLPHTLMVYGFQMDTPEHTHEALVVRSGSRASSIDDLKGKIIATFPGVAAKAYLDECLQKAGFKGYEINLKPMQASLQVQALLANQVDAILAYEPLPTLGRVEGWGRSLERALFPRYILSPMPVTVFPLRRAFVEKNPQVADALVAAVGDAIAYINEYPAAANRTMAKYTGLKDESVAESVGQMLNVLVKDADLKQVQAFADWHAQKGLVSRSITVVDVIFRPEE
jgi:NitT/TauT family transport system substrate-binding protein